jgi:hypothetical protein
LEWLVPIVVLGVWILSSLLRNNEEERRNPRKPRPFPDREGGQVDRPQGKSSSDIDRFLEEVNRRRRQAGEARKVPPPPERPQVRTPPVAEAVPVQRQRRPPPAQGGRPVTPRARRQPVPERVVEVLPQAEPVTAVEVVPPAAPVLWPPVEDAYKLAGATSAGVAQVTGIRKPSPELTQLAALLRTPQSMRSAMLLRIIFDPPVCRRNGLAGQG